MAEFQRRLNELRREIESGNINPEDFNLEIMSFEECKKSKELYQLLVKKIKELPPEKRAPYEEARKNIIKSSMKYTLERLEENFLRAYPELAKYSD